MLKHLHSIIQISIILRCDEGRDTSITNGSAHSGALQLTSQEVKNGYRSVSRDILVWEKRAALYSQCHAEADMKFSRFPQVKDNNAINNTHIRF